MKVTYIKSATVIVEYNGVKVLCDPWLTDGIYYGSWYHYPPLSYTPEDVADVDYIYISHIHPDHMDRNTLGRLPKNIPVLIHDYEEKYLLRIIQSLGFEKIIEIAHKQTFSLSEGFTLEILAADNCDPKICGKFFGCPISGHSEKTLQIDSLALFHGGDFTVLNTNDCQFELAGGVCDYIAEKYSSIDLILVGYSSATAYPQCFSNLSVEKKIAEKLRIRHQFLEKACSYISRLNAKHFLPFAGQYVLGGKLFTLNKFRSPPYMEELPRLFKALLTEKNILSEMILLNSGEHFDLKENRQSKLFVSANPEEREQYIREVLSKKKFLYETDFYIPPEERTDLLIRLQNAHEKMCSRMKQYGYQSDWKVYLDTDQGFLYEIPFNENPVKRVDYKKEVKPFVRISLDYSLLIMILDRKAHWNNAEIGSHLTFYRDPEEYEVGVYRFLSYLHN